MLVDTLTSDGGTERMVGALGDTLVARGYDVSILTRLEPPFAALELDPRVVTGRLTRRSGTKLVRPVRVLRTVRSLRTWLKSTRPDVAMGVKLDSIVLLVLASIGLRVPMIGWLHGNLVDTKLSTFWTLIRRVAVRRLRRLVVVNEGSAAYAERLLPGRVTFVPNFVSDRGDPHGVDLWEAFPGGRPLHRIVAVGRLEPDKGFDLLIEGFAMVAHLVPTWSVMIAGRGPESASLQAAIDRHGLGGRVFLAGPTPDPAATMANSDLLVLSSRTEAFPLVLLEAAREGVPMIAFECSSGPRQILRDGGGVLVPPRDVRALSDAMLDLMTDGEKRRALGRETRVIKRRYSADLSVAAFESVFSEASGRQLLRPGSQH
jgi:glycosyltransferase involved in cell wall biosynthesis